MVTIEKEKALDVVRQMVADGQVSQEVAEKYFPELKESKDERILKHLIGVVELYYGKTDEQEKKDCLAWLEKQGKKKTEVKYVYTKFQIGDVIVEIKPNGYCQPVRVKYVGEESYYCKSDDEKRFLSFPIISQDKYVLVTKEIEQKKAPIEGEFPYDNPSDTLEGEIENIWGKLSSEGRFSATKEGFREVITHFVNYIKDRVQPQPKQEWGEEDEEMCAKTLFALAGYRGNEDKIDWLKSLKDRCTWKPSEEQIEALSAINVTGGISYAGQRQELINLYNDLKKIKG